MKKITVQLGRTSYPIIIGKGVLKQVPSLMSSYRQSDKGVIVTDERIWKLYGQQFCECLKENGLEIFPFVMPRGEKRKNLVWVRKIYDFLIEKGCDRSSFVIAFGGGVIGDLAGFVAATYMRGIRFFQVPTTLLAQVDASIGGKVGVNVPQGKNLVGAFYQPSAVLIDYSLLKTLSYREMRCGMAEVIKYGIIHNTDLFAFLEEQMTSVYSFSYQSLERIISDSCQIKAAVVSEDEKESGLRAILNFGHTIGHALETDAFYKNISHGEGVSIGMVVAARISHKMGYIPKELVLRIENLIKKAGLPIRYSQLNIPEIIRIMKIDKKRVKGVLHFVLLSQLGSPLITSEVGEETIKMVLKEIKA
ncbi:3-dehydroquinate synthase [Chlamydiota bacterium]